MRLNPTRHKALLKWKALKSIGSIKPSSRVLDQINKSIAAEQQQATNEGGMKLRRSRQGSILNMPTSTQEVAAAAVLSKKESCRQWVEAETARLEAERGPYPGWQKKKTLEQLEQLTVCDAYTASLSQTSFLSDHK